MINPNPPIVRCLWSAKFRHVLAAFLVALTLTSCADTGVENLTDYSGDSLPPTDSAAARPATAGEEPPPLDAVFWKGLRPCDGFDYPVAPPDAKNYFKARGFLPVNLEHLGEDWNGHRGGNSDFGDYVYAAADGVVFFSGYVNQGWGTVIRMLHNYGTDESPRYVETLYAHVSSAWARVGNEMRRGQTIGTIGNAEGKYHAHLHFETRLKPGKDIRCGYDGDTLGFVDPTAFIEQHRPK